MKNIANSDHSTLGYADFYPLKGSKALLAHRNSTRAGAPRTAAAGRAASLLKTIANNDHSTLGWPTFYS
jgi:hypothetical protein